MVITLIGYRGSGKSAVAEPLAERLGWEWCDADADIERRAGRTIRDIFASDGETTFREMERQVMAELLDRDRLVIAAGGGAVLNDDTREEMQQAGPVVWLQASVSRLAERLGDDATTAARRPDLTQDGGRREIEQLLEQREPIYRQSASVTIDTNDKSIEQVVEMVLTAVAPAVHEEPSE